MSNTNGITATRMKQGREMVYKITENGFPALTISRMDKGDRIYAEMNSCIACSPIFDQDDYDNGRPTGMMKRRRILPAELEGEDYTPVKKPTFLSQRWSDFKLDTKQTLDRERIGEQSYVLYEAMGPKQKVSFRSCFPGTIMAWNARPLEDFEYYVAPWEDDPKTIYDPNEDNRPHGVLRAVHGSFLAADLRVKAKVFHTGKVLVRKSSGTDDSFQEFNGSGIVFLEVHGDLQEIPLHPGEGVDVFKGYLLGFTEGVTLEMKPAGSVILRKEEANDYVIRCTAGEKGGYVYTHSVRPREFFGRAPKPPKD